MARKQQVEQQNIAEGIRQSDREQRVFQTLLNADDPDVRNLAVAGMLNSANPRTKAKGLRGWIGETEGSPYLAQIEALSQTPKAVPEQVPAGPPTIGVMQSAQGVPLMPEVKPAVLGESGDAGMPPTSPVQPGNPPPTPTRPIQTMAPPTPQTITQMAMRPREVFLNPGERYQQQAAAKEIGDITGMRAGLRAAGFNDEDATNLLRQHIARKYGAVSPYGAGPAKIEVQDAQGNWIPYPGLAGWDHTRGIAVDSETGQQIYGARLAQTTAGMSYGTLAERLNHLLFGKPARLNTQAESATLEQALQAQKQALSPKDALTLASKFLPNATLEQQFALADALKGGTAAPAPAAPATPPGGPPPPTTSATPTSTVAPPSTTPTAPPRPGGLSGMIPPGMGGATKDTGKPLPTAVATSLAKAKSTNDLIDQALTALSPFKDDNTLQGSIKLAEGYRHGQYSPVFSAAAQLSDLAGLQSSAQAQLTGGASRAMKFYVDRRQHVPRLPSGRQTTFAGIVGAKATERGSEMIHGDEGGFDTPQMMYQKLLNAKENNANFIRELESATKAPGAHSGGPALPNIQIRNGKSVLINPDGSETPLD